MLAAEGGGRHIAITMRIICPACAATYEVPDRLIGGGRSLRCRSCSHAWRVAPEQAVVESPPPLTAAPPAPPAIQPPPAAIAPPPQALPLAPPPLAAAPRRLPQLIDPPLPRPDDRPQRAGPALRLAWAASLLAVLSGVGALWLFSAEISAAWPPAARLYHLFEPTAAG